MTLDELLCGLEIEVGDRSQTLEDLNSERDTLLNRLSWVEDSIQTLEYEVSRIRGTIKVLKKEY